MIGMMTALQLADAGQRVTLIERGTCGKEASWAGGGIVSPLYPWRYGEPVSQLSRWSEGAYPTPSNLRVGVSALGGPLGGRSRPLGGSSMGRS